MRCGEDVAPVGARRFFGEICGDISPVELCAPFVGDKNCVLTPNRQSASPAWRGFFSSDGRS
ncbi:hypothetical protein TIFTF001_036350 [Ficus carica]|uniref:Uncharacterized protein n=1 Tax=Ficus carica TaxID=3494 RepID=A0AA88E436_FICCA|nr:hypothetical protein TIFTF001_036350 [Ficus carica]